MRANGMSMVGVCVREYISQSVTGQVNNSFTQVEFKPPPSRDRIGVGVTSSSSAAAAWYFEPFLSVCQ